MHIDTYFLTVLGLILFPQEVINPFWMTLGVPPTLVSHPVSASFG